MDSNNSGRSQITLSINDIEHHLEIFPWTTLVDALREHLQMTGTKKGCDHGQCGACTVLIDDKHINSCLALAIMQQGKRITTIEGLANNEKLSDVQEAFIEEDAFQCGYCTPGQICSITGLIKMGRKMEPEELRDLMSGNICRCGAYVNIYNVARNLIDK